MSSSDSNITYMGDADFRNKKTRFGIYNIDRARHMYVIGKTGMGKSTLLENMAAQDIQNGEGLCFVDPHGSSAELLLEYVPEHRINDVLYFAPFDNQYPIGFNPLEDVDPDNRHLVASGLMSAFKKIWVDSFSARMEYILSNAILALLEAKDSTLLSVNRMLVEKEFRKTIVDQITDPTVKAFWVDEYEKWEDRYRKEAGAAIQNKVGQFVSNPLIRNIVGQPKSSFDLRSMMDNKKIIIVNLSKGQIGEQNAGLLGGMFITKLYLAAMSRADLDKNQLAELPAHYFYVDEFQSFANESFADILSEARKYKLALTVAHQYVAQMPDEVKEAIFGNVGSMVVFRVGPGDAEHFEREFAPVFTEQDIVNIGRFQYYLRLMIDGMGSQPFSAVGIPPLEKPPTSNKQAVIEMSRQKYAGTREEVDKRITEWYIPIPSEKDLEHKAYIEKKKAEFKAQGKEWVDFSKNPEKKAQYDKQKEQSPKKEFKKKEHPRKNNYQKDKPFKKEFKKPDFKKNEPSVSPKLQDLIGAIESGDAKPVGDKKPAPVEKKEDKISLSDLKTKKPSKELERKASDEKVSSLKDALLKAGLGSTKKEESVSKGDNSPKSHNQTKDVNRQTDVLSKIKINPKHLEKKKDFKDPESVKRQVLDKEESPTKNSDPVKNTSAPKKEHSQEVNQSTTFSPKLMQQEKKVSFGETSPEQKEVTTKKSTPKEVKSEKPQGEALEQKSHVSFVEKKGEVRDEEVVTSVDDVTSQNTSAGKYSPDELLESILKD